MSSFKNPTSRCDVSYCQEKISAAVDKLMLPHYQGEANSLATAMTEIQLGFKHLQTASLTDSEQKWVGRIKELMDTSANSNDAKPEKGLIGQRAERLSLEERGEFASLVRELESSLR